MDAAQWSQQMASNLQRPMEEVTSSPTTPNTTNPTNSRGVTQQQALERRTRPQKDQNLGCPRCHSTNTKFCYYNNYSLTQPRYFCKTCRRYWTQGGSLRSVPVGGGSRKNKRSSSSSSSSILTSPQLPPQSTMHNKLMIPDLNPPTSLSHLLTSPQNPNVKFLEAHDLNLAFPMQSLFHHHHHNIDHQLPKIEGNNHPNENHEPPISLNPNNMSTNNSISAKTTTTTTPTSTPFSALELLRTGIASRGNMNPYAHMPMPGSSTLYQSGYPNNVQEFIKPSMSMFSPPSDHNTMDGSNDHHHHHHHNESHTNDDNNIVQSGARLLFPFADMNKLATNTQQQHHDDQIDENDQSKGNNGNDDHHHHDLNHHHSGYWSGMLGGGTW